MVQKSKIKKEMSDAERAHWLEKARRLSEALPYMRTYAGKTFVIKFGGHAMGDPSLAELFARDIVLFKQVGINPIVVHGGGPQIGDMLERLKIKSSFIDGLRVTDKATVEIVEMVLAGSINKQIVAAISQAGGRAIGLSGKDSNLILAEKLQRKTRDPDSNIEKVVDLGFVGEPTKINAEVLADLARSNVIPVIAPLGVGPHGTTLNINADTAAGAIAAAVKAERLLMLTDVAGVLDKKGELIPQMTASQVQARKKDKTIHGGMIPKVETCLAAVRGGVEAAVILDGRVPHALLLEIFTKHGVGTLIRDNTGRKRQR
ncbi:MAG: acetylglutamate kinase [Proteobacteria bacterium]|nr:acetylglutamate kinase [Pseudomonadota bacterium]